MDRYVWEIVVLGRVSSIMGAHSHFRLMVELNKDPSSNRTLTITNADAQYYCKHVFQWSLVFRMPSDISSYVFSFRSIWVFPKIVVPQNEWFIMENPIKMDDLGGKPTIFGNIHLASQLMFGIAMSDVLTWLSLRNSEDSDPPVSTGGNSEGPAMFNNFFDIPLSHRIHAWYIFTYMKAIKINQM